MRIKHHVEELDYNKVIVVKNYRFLSYNCKLEYSSYCERVMSTKHLCINNSYSLFCI